jgi:uncharacterized membrane protein
VRRWLPAVALLSLLTGLASAASFEVLDLPVAAAWTRSVLSRDGSKLGVNAGGLYLLRDRGGGFQEIGTGHPLATDIGISPDGFAICGTIVDSRGRRTPAIWNAGSGWTALSATGRQITGGSLGSAFGLGDGVTVGLVWEAAKATACRWSLTEGLALLPDSGRDSRASAVSADGRVVVGFDEHPLTGQRRPARWVDGVLDLIAGVESRGEILAVSAAGDRCCGQRDGRAFYHDERLGLVDLGLLEDAPREESRATAVSNAGIVVGWSGDPSLGRRRSFVWTVEIGMQSLAAWFERLDVALPDSLELTVVEDISSDGSTMVGTWQDRSWRQGLWLVTGLDEQAYATLRQFADEVENQAAPDGPLDWPGPPARPGRPGRVR